MQTSTTLHHPAYLGDTAAMQNETPGHPGQNETEPVTFFVLDRRILGDENIIVVGAKTEDLCLKTYAALIDQAIGESSYLVRAYRVPVPEDMDVNDARRAAEETVRLATAEYKREGIVQVAAFARLDNDVIVDMNLLTGPHLAAD
jgi:hypothetical protein